MMCQPAQRGPGVRRAAVCALSLLFTLAAAAVAAGDLGSASHEPLPSGQLLTPTAAPGSLLTALNPGLAAHPGFVANGGIKTALSPDGKTLLVLTSGYNVIHNGSGSAHDLTSQYLFVYNVAGARKRSPALIQVLQIPDTYVGLAWAPGSRRFYVSGGTRDCVYVYTGSAAARWSLAATVPMGHEPFVPASSPFSRLIFNGVGFHEKSSVAGLGISRDGTVLVAANIYNDSITVIDTAKGTVRLDYDLRPYNTSGKNGVAGGETPFGVALVGDHRVYVSSIRDREVVVLNLRGSTARLIRRIPLPGNANSMALSADQSRLYVTQDNSDSVAVIDTASNTVLEEISTIAPPGVVPSGTRYTGAAANDVAISPDGRTLYVTNGGANSVAVIPIAGRAPHTVAGLIPTGWYPNSVSVSHDGSTLYVVNGKSDAGPNPGYERGSPNQYVLQLAGGSLLTIPVPGTSTLASLTVRVAANNGYSARESASDEAMMAALHRKIRHVIYIVKENRTFDQILGDLGNGSNGDPALVMYGRRVTPNFHALARAFVTLDNFFCSGEVSGNGWSWSTGARESDHGEKSVPINYALRGASNDSEGLNRNVNVGFPTPAGRDTSLGGHGIWSLAAGMVKGGAANLLPGTNDDFGLDGPDGAAQAGYLWNAALRAGLSLRNYGFFIDLLPYQVPRQIGGLVPSDYPQQGFLQRPFALGRKVAVSTNPALQPYTDPYFWGFDNAYPDAWREQEWQREFQTYVPSSPTYKGRTLPALTLLRLMHDHTGNFGGRDPAVAGLTTPELQQADNDVSVGEVVEAVAHSPYASNTLIFVLEDDAQDGPDHMDAQRSTAYIIGPYVKQHAVISTRYSTVNMLRTIEDVLGLGHLNLNDAYQRPMADVFDLAQRSWTYTATMSPYLKGTLAARTVLAAHPQIRFADLHAAKPARSARWWARTTQGFDWSDADRIAGTRNKYGSYLEIEWHGVRPGVPYPRRRSGIDLGRHATQPAAPATAGPVATSTP